ncbi:hypothetical protein ACH9L7_11290 [Haloferax sp. S1W]|uniref:hypothetical protein n=1 Tax=Haloferax sp. S1W TaxID=3377110 RepID=UPI0037CB781E
MIQLATTYTAVGLSTAAAYLAGVHGETAPALALALVALVFIALRVSMMDLGFGHILDDAPTEVKVISRRVAALALVGMLVTSSATAPAAATSIWGDECSTLDSFIYDVMTFQNVNEDPDHPCSTQYQVSQAVSELQQTDANQTKVDMFAAATAQDEQKEQGLVTTENYLQDTESTAWMKAQVAIAEAYTNGATKAEAKVAAREAIAAYYSTKSVNLINSWNTSLIAAKAISDRSAMEDGISRGDVMALGRAGGPWRNDSTGTSRLTGSDTATTVTLPNGSSSDVYALEVYAKWDDWGFEGNRTFALNSSSPTYQKSNTGDTITLSYIWVWAPNSNYNHQEYLNQTRYNTLFTAIQAQNDALQAEADHFVDATWTDFESGRINASDVISGHTAMFEYGVRSANESEGLYRSTAALALMGFDTPSLNSSGMMNVTYNGVTYQGLVLARNAPGGAWQANTTYNASNITGPVFMATVDGEKVDFTGEFTITEMTAKDGTEVQSQNTTTYVYKTANTTELLEMQQQLTELRQEIEEREATVGGGGGGLDLGNLTGETKAIIVLIAVAVIVVFRG